jgi:hypothetical protein
MINRRRFAGTAGAIALGVSLFAGPCRRPDGALAAVHPPDIRNIGSHPLRIGVGREPRNKVAI